MTAAAEAIVGIENVCKRPEEFLITSEVDQTQNIMLEGALVCTVGEIAALPGASNVIPGEVRPSSFQEFFYLSSSLYFNFPVYRKEKGEGR